MIQPIAPSLILASWTAFRSKLCLKYDCSRLNLRMIKYNDRYCVVRPTALSWKTCLTLLCFFSQYFIMVVLEGSVDGLRHQGRPKRQWMDDIEEWSGCSYIQLKGMSQDREQWRRKTIEWSSAVANRHRRWSTSEWVNYTSRPKRK